MKKKYLSPEVIELVEAMEELMIATSPDGFDGNLDNNNDNVITNPDDILSRHGSVWNDSEDID